MYKLARHQPSGEVYALLIEANKVKAVCGPLHHTEQAGELADYNYEAEDADWAEKQGWTTIRAAGSFVSA